MHRAVVKEQVCLRTRLHQARNAFKKVDELVGIEGVVFDLIVQQSVACTDCCTNSLTWLIAYAFLNLDVFIRCRPCTLNVSSASKDRFVNKDKVMIIVLDLLNLPV